MVDHNDEQRAKERMGGALDMLSMTVGQRQGDVLKPAAEIVSKALRADRSM